MDQKSVVEVMLRFESHMLQTHDFGKDLAAGPYPDLCIKGSKVLVKIIMGDLNLTIHGDGIFYHPHRVDCLDFESQFEFRTEFNEEGTALISY